MSLLGAAQAPAFGRPPAAGLQSAEDQRLTLEVVDAARSSARDPAAAARLQELLVQVDERLASGGAVGESLLGVVSELSYLHLNSALDPSERFLDSETCLRLAERAAEALHSPGVRAELRAWAALNLLRVLGQPADPAEAESKLRALAHASPSPSHRLRAELLLEVAELARSRSDFDEARRLLKEASSILGEVRTDREGPAAELEGAIEAQGAMLAALRMRAELKLGLLEVDLGRPDLAARHFLTSRPAAAAAGGPFLREQRLHEARFWVSVDDQDSAIERCDLVLADPGVEAVLVPSAHFHRGVARFQLAREAGTALDGARADLEAALAAGATATLAAECRFRLGEIAVEEGDLERAEAQLVAARTALGQAVRAPPALSVQIASLEVRVARLAGSRSRERLQADLDRLRELVEESMTDFRRLETVVGGVGFLRYPFRVEPILEWIEAELELEPGARGVEQALAPWIRAQMLGFLARGLGVCEPSLADVRGVLPHVGILLAWLPGQRATLLFVLEREGSPEVFHLPGRWALNRRIERQAERLATRRGDGASDKELEAEAEDLAEVLIPSAVAKRLTQGRRVVCVGFDLLGRMPLETLRLPGGHWLGSTVAVEHWPSIPVAVELARRHGGSAEEEREGALGFLAPSSTRSKLAPLEFGKEEREALERAWPGLEVLSGGEASEASAARLEAEPWGAALFLAHGLEDFDRPVPNGIALAAGGERDGDLWSEEVRALRAVPPLVVLGVCGAGFGAPRLGEDGAQHLGGVWIERGARSVVVSAFALERGVTVRTLDELGQGLTRGASLPEAMRAARSTVVEERPASIHPLLLQVVGWSP